VVQPDGQIFSAYIDPNRLRVFHSASAQLALTAALVLTSSYMPHGTRNTVSPSTSSAIETSFGFHIPDSRDTAWAELYVPPNVREVRAAVVFIDRELDRYAYDDRDWRAMCRRAQCALVRVGFPRQDGVPPQRQRVRNAALGGDSIVAAALQLGAERTAHPELRDARLILFGFSAAGSFGPTFAALHPDRTIGFIRYHSNLRGLAVDTAALVSIPALTVAGARDEIAGSEDSRALWRALRARGAPWAYVDHFAQPHLSIDGLVEAGPAMRDWTEALLDHRAPPSSSGAPRADAGWLVDDSIGVVRATREITRAPNTSWVPDARTAFALRQLEGMCAQLPLTAATDMLGGGTKLDSEDTSVCHYVHDAPHRDLWASASSSPSDSAAMSLLRRAPGAIPLAGLGEAAELMIETKQRCGTIGAVRSSWVFYVTACGDGFGTAGDSSRLRAISRRVLGEP